MLTKFLSKNGWAFMITFIIVTITSILAMAIPNEFGNVIKVTKSWLSNNLSVAFLITPLIFLVVILFFIFTKWGKRTIGDGRPQYKTFTWLAMLFTAGVGVGTLTFGVAEPIYHAADPHVSGSIGTAAAHGTGAFWRDTSNILHINNSAKAAMAFKQAIAYSIWDWGLPAMAIYTVSGLVVSWFAFNKRYKSSFQPGSVIESGFGGKPWAQKLGQGANVLAAVTAVFTVAASLAIAGGNMTESLKIAFFPNSNFSASLVKWLAIGFIALIAFVYIIGSITPLKKGMAVLGNYTMYIGLGILGFVFLVGPTQFFIKQIVDGIGSIPGSLSNHFKTFPYDSVSNGTATAWLTGWPIAYILWWISWTPFMGVFLARISKGRTFRQYALASVVVPAIFMAIWFSVFGGFTFFNFQNGGGSIFNKVAATGSVNGAFFELMSKLPLFEILGVITLLVFVTFVATTGISASVSVASIVSKKGDEKPAKTSILVWAIGTTCIAIGLKLASRTSGDSMTTIRDAAVLLGAPYLVVIYLQIIALFKSIIEEKRLVKEGKVEIYKKEKNLPKYIFNKTKYLKTRLYSIVSNVTMLVVWIIISTLVLRGVFSGHKGWSLGMTTMNDISSVEYAFGVVGITMIIITIINNSLITKKHTNKKLMISLILSIITFNIGGIILNLKFKKDMKGRKLYNNDIKVKELSPIEYETWLKKDKKLTTL